jgi:hypothetical protein
LLGSTWLRGGDLVRRETHDYLRASRSEFDQPGQFVDGLPDIPGDLSEIFEEAAFEAAQRFNPGLTRSTTLLARLHGNESVEDGLDSRLAEKVIPPLAAEIESAAGKYSKNARMKLVDVSPGSVVLHFKPEIPNLEAAGAFPGSDQTPANDAIRQVMALHDMIESRAESNLIASKFHNKDRLLKAAARLLESLNESDINLSLRWWSPDGKRHYSALSESGRSYAQSLFKKIEKSVEVTISGKISGLDLSGNLSVTEDRTGSKKKIRIEPDILMSNRFNLGDQVTIRATETSSVNRVGVSSRDSLDFISLDEKIPFPESE